MRELRARFVFVGGAATNLLISDRAAPEVRVTRDVDLVVDVMGAVAVEIRRLLEEPEFRSALAGHLPPDPVSQARAGLILQRLEALAR